MDNIVKVVYFDEGSVTDLIQIINGGNMKTTTDFITDLETQMNAKGNADISVDSKGISKVFSFLSGINVEASASAGGSIARKKDKVVKNILENTMLTDFLFMLKQDSRRKHKKFTSIRIFENLELYPGNNTFSYIMLIAPYMNMIDGKLEIDSEKTLKIDLSKVQETMEHGRGYYEFIGINDNKEIIFRFNYKAFRNGYTMADLSKMELSLYAVKVGKTSLDKLDISTEFEFGVKEVKRLDYAAQKSGEIEEKKVLDVYDVLLAGIKG